jgi:hypothetical protein
LSLKDYIEKLKRKASTAKVEIGVFDPERADVALMMEYGTQQIPARPFLKLGVEDAKDIITEHVAAALADLADKEETDSLDKMGKAVSQHVREYVEKNSLPPPLSPATVKAKGHSHALIDTRKMVDDITYRVDKR